MTTEQITTVVTSILQGGVLLYVGHQIIRGLRERITGLEDTLRVQKGTLDAMEQRVSETQKVGDIYRTLLATLPQDIDQFKTIIQKTRDESIVELTNQAENMRSRLHEAENKLKAAEKGDINIERQLRILKVLLNKRKVSSKMFGVSNEQDFDIAKISEQFLGSTEKAVPILVTCKTLDEFLSRIGATIHKDVEDVPALMSYMRDPANSPNIHRAMFSMSVNTGAYAVINNDIHFSTERYSSVQDEFAILKGVE